LLLIGIAMHSMPHPTADSTVTHTATTLPAVLQEPAAAGSVCGADQVASTVSSTTDRRKSAEPFEGADKRMGDRRAEVDRRFVDIGSPTGLERRRGAGVRRNDDRRAAEEGEMTDEQFEFMLAIDTYKRINHRPFPTWTEVLEVVKQLGYRKVAASTIALPNATGRSQSNNARD
jgi:hypothetical protein